MPQIVKLNFALLKHALNKKIETVVSPLATLRQARQELQGADEGGRERLWAIRRP